jgi:hypothetical protein
MPRLGMKTVGKNLVSVRPFFYIGPIFVSMRNGTQHHIRERGGGHKAHTPRLGMKTVGKNLVSVRPFFYIGPIFVSMRNGTGNGTRVTGSGTGNG